MNDEVYESFRLFDTTFLYRLRVSCMIDMDKAEGEKREDTIKTCLGQIGVIDRILMERKNARRDGGAGR